MIDIVEQPCQVTALHHIGNYGGLGGSFLLPQTVCIEKEEPDGDKEEGRKEDKEGLRSVHALRGGVRAEG